MRSPWGRRGLVLLLVAATGLPGCAAGRAYRRGKSEAKNRNWDLAVARFALANDKDPRNITYKIALDNARIEASRYHHSEGRRHLAADALWRAADELEIASKYDRGNKSIADDLLLVKEKMRKREEEKRRLSEFDAMKARAQAARVPVPVLSPRSPVPITLKFDDSSLQKIFDTLAKLSGVNILFDGDFRDKRVPVSLANVTFQEALDQITFVNRLFYKVLDQNTIIIVPESPAKRRSYDENLVQTFYLQNADANETLTLVKNLTGVTKAAVNLSLGALTIMGTPDELAFAARVIETNDKPKGEVMVEVEILEVNRTRTKAYGLQLSNYQVSTTFAPTGGSGELAGGFTNIRAHLLSSLNVSDFLVSIPSTLLARFLQDDTNVRILASPRLRAAEGKKTSLKIVSQIPVPTTTFQATNTGGSTFTPTTTIQYKDVGVTLDLTPKVNASGEIALEMSAEFSLEGAPVNIAGVNQPSFLTRNVNGILRLRDGETSLIGGLLQDRETESFKGIFGLQSVPILNKLLTSTDREREETEILISITPHLVRAAKITEDDLKSLYVGTKETIKVPSARPSLFGPPEVPPAPAAPPTPAPPGASPPPPPGPVSEKATSPAAPAAGEPGVPAPSAPMTPPGPTPPTAQPPAPPASTPIPAPGPTPEEERRIAAVFSPPEIKLKVGEMGSLSLVVVGLKDLMAVDLVLTYDPAILEAVDVGPGPLLTLDGAAVGAERSLEPGRVRARFTRPGATAGSGAVVSFRIKGLREGSGSLTVESLRLSTAAGTERPPLPGPGRVVVLP